MKILHSDLSPQTQSDTDSSSSESSDSSSNSSSTSSSSSGSISSSTSHRTSINNDVLVITGDEPAKSPNSIRECSNNGENDLHSLVNDALDDDDDDEFIIKDEYDDDTLQAELLEMKRGSSLLAEGRNLTTKVLSLKRFHSSSPVNYKSTTPFTCGDSIEIKCLMNRAQFFLARACDENVELAMKKDLWTTHPRIEKLLTEAFFKAPVLILIFLARNSDHFSGFARVCSQALYKGQPAMQWVDFKGGGNIKIEWISKKPLLLTATQHIKNPFNNERVIYAASDGCEVQRAAGQKLCNLFSFDDSVDLKSIFFNCRKERELRSKDGLPSLLDRRISYNDFKRTRNRKESSRKLITNEYLVGKPRPLIQPKVILNNLFEPLPLMDLSTSRPSSSDSKRKRYLSPVTERKNSKYETLLYHDRHSHFSQPKHFRIENPTNPHRPYGGNLRELIPRDLYKSRRNDRPVRSRH